MTSFKRFFTLFLIATVSFCAWGADVTTSWTASSGALGSGIGSGTINTRVSGTTTTHSWNYTRTLSSGTSYTGWTSNCIQLGKNGGVENLTLSTSNIPGTIKSVSVECSSYQGKHNVAITVGSTTYLASTATPSWTTVGAKSGTGTSSGTITISFTGGSRALYIKSITVVYNNDGGGSCTDPTTPLSISNAATATVGNSLSLTTTGGNGSSVTWSIVSGGSYATLSGSTLTPTAVGTVRVQASQGVSGGKCGATLTQDITISLAPINVTLYYKGTSTTLNNQPNPYTLPTTGTYAADACDAWTFDGWYNSSYAKNTSKPTYITQLTSSGNAYAVYKHTETSGASTPITRTMNSFDAISGYVGGDANISYAAAQGGASTAPGVYSNIIRIYQNGGTLTLTANNGKKISRVTIGSSMGTTVRYQVDGGAPSSNRNISANGTVTTPEIDGGANSVTFTCMGTTNSTRLYLNYLSVTYSDDGGSTTYYSTDAECGPKVQTTASPWVTSTQGATVKVEVPVTATNFDKNSTLSASVSGTGFSFVGWGANGNSVTAGEDLTTSLILEYNPTVFSSDATITFNSTYSGSQTPVYTPGTVHGRSLPGLFVIAIKNGGTWYALPANMDGAGTYAGVAVDVDDSDNPTKVTAGPATALYRLTGVHPSRHDAYGTRVRFMSEYNSKCLWNNTATGGTGINNGALLNNATSDNYEWTLVTTDGVTYAINTNVDKKIEEGRELRYRVGESRFGMYTDGNSAFRLLRPDCWTRATVSEVSSTYNSVTLTWAGKSGTEYNVYIDEGGVTKKTELNVTSPITISGLSSETNYTWIISPGAKNDDCALSGDFTTNVAPINVTLSCDGTEYHLGPQDKPYTLPTTGVYVSNACTEWTFEGWTANTHSKSTSKPTMIDQVSTDGTVYAVYKNTEGGSNSGSLTITEVQTGGSSYNTSYSVTEYTSESDAITIASNNILNNVDYIQLKAGAGNRIYNTTAMPGAITQITVTATTNSAYVYVGSSSVGSGSTALEPTSGSRSGTAVYTIPAGNTYFAVGATSDYVKVSNIEVLYSSSTTYYATSSECCNEVAVPTVVVEPIDVSATISWDSQVGATNGYHVTCSNGTDQDVAAGVTSLVISSLDASTTYTYTVTAKGATCNRTFEGSFTTASCSDVPTDVTVSAGTHTATIRWTASASTATVVIYDDDLGNSTVQSVENQTSPCTISGLNDNTDYYLQVFAGGVCPHPIKPFATQSTAVSIAEWFPDGININLDADETTATVLIEDKQENTTTSTSYAEGLFFSKYYEAYRNVKLWAVFNGTTEKISLANIKVKSSNNGSGWGKDKTTGADDNAKITSLAPFGHFETGYIYPGEEIIVYSDGNDSQDAAIISCMESTYGDAYKNNPDSLWYLVKNQTTSLSGDDGLILLDGTDTLDVIGGTNANAAYLAANASPGWGDADGWNCDVGEDAEGNTIALSTNRCLLVRKNTVKSGLNAVTQNKEDFNTLCEEWWGAHVAGGGDEVQSSCDNFSYVGHYDYNKYYAHFDSITTVDELSGQKNEDGTYTIPIPHLDTLSCTMLRVKVYEGGVEKASTEYKVPIMVEGAHSTKDTIFICDYPTQTRTAATCKDCDVVILKGGVLTKASSGETGDNAEVRDLTIYPGGTLIVPEGPQYEYTVNSILFRVEKETAPVAKLKGDLITKTEQVIVTRRIKNDRYYFFSLPYDCNIADICWPNGEKPVRGVDYEIVEYDGERRANEGSTQGAPGHWKLVEGTQLKAGVGYNVAVASDILKELVFPMAIGQTNLTNKEDNKTSNKVTIHQYTNTGTTINNHNWNLVAHPYVSAFSAYTGDKITAGYLEYTEPANLGEAGSWDRSETDKVYLTMPSFNSGGITYTQTVSSGISSLNPFLAVFVQGAGEGDMTFEQSARKLSAPARHLAAQAEDEDESIFAGVTLSGNGESDQTNLRIRPDFTDEYQLGYDLEKFITFYTPRPQVYMKTPAYRLAFQAVSDDVAKNTFLPMGVYCYQAGTYTFALYDRYPIDELEAAYLFDKQTGITTNLLYDSYSFTTTGQIYTNTRFSLNVIVKRRITETPTDVENLEAPDLMVRKILINGHVYIQRGGAIYDVTGKQMLNH